MIGGSYDYLYCKVEEMADRVGRGNSPERQRFAEHLRRVAKAMHAIEWVDSCVWAAGDENEAIRAVFDPSANAAVDIACAERKMLDAFARADALRSAHIRVAAYGNRSGTEPTAYREAEQARLDSLRIADTWLALVEARDAKGGGA